MQVEVDKLLVETSSFKFKKQVRMTNLVEISSDETIAKNKKIIKQYLTYALTKGSESAKFGAI